MHTAARRVSYIHPRCSLFFFEPVNLALYIDHTVLIHGVTPSARKVQPVSQTVTTKTSKLTIAAPVAKTASSKGAATKDAGRVQVGGGFMRFKDAGRVRVGGGFMRF